jgi:hypothetical protein
MVPADRDDGHASDFKQMATTTGKASLSFEISCSQLIDMQFVFFLGAYGSKN